MTDRYLEMKLAHIMWPNVATTLRAMAAEESVQWAVNEHGTAPARLLIKSAVARDEVCGLEAAGLVGVA